VHTLQEGKAKCNRKRAACKRWGDKHGFCAACQPRSRGNCFGDDNDQGQARITMMWNTEGAGDICLKKIDVQPNVVLPGNVGSSKRNQKASL